MSKVYPADGVSSYDAYPARTEPRKLFDVTCVVGSVYEGDNSGFTPREAAFLLIARHGGNGATYNFPTEEGGEEHVTVETTQPTPV